MVVHPVQIVQPGCDRFEGFNPRKQSRFLVLLRGRWVEKYHAPHLGSRLITRMEAQMDGCDLMVSVTAIARSVDCTIAAAGSAHEAFTHKNLVSGTPRANTPDLTG